MMKWHIKGEVAQSSTPVQTHKYLPQFPLHCLFGVKKAGKIFPSKAVFPESWFLSHLLVSQAVFISLLLIQIWTVQVRNQPCCFYCLMSHKHKMGFPSGSDGKESTCQETWLWSLGWEDPLEEGMATYSSVLAWRISMDGGAWRATVRGVTKLDTTKQLSTAHSKHKIVFVGSCWWEPADKAHGAQLGALWWPRGVGCRESRREVQERGDVLYI